ncbi:MAG: tetratricopeptide repeat protein [Acidobacteriota bacterium]
MGWEASEKSIFLSRIFEFKRQRDYLKMEQEIETALDRYPSELQFKVLLAEAYWFSGRCPEAKLLLEELEESAQHLHGFQGLKGTVEMASGAPQKALEAFRSAYALKTSPFYLKRQADCLIRLHRYDEALALLRQGPGQPDVYVLGAMARAYEGLDRVKEAQDCYQSILRARPGDPYAKSHLLKLKVAATERPQAEEELNRMLRLPSHRDDVALLRVKADHLKDEGRFAEAAETYGKIVDLSEGKERDFFSRAVAFAYYRAGMDQKAYSCLIRLVETHPQDAYVRSALISVARKLDRLQELIDFLRDQARRRPADRFLFGVARKLQRELPR